MIKIKCFVCKKELDEPGALLFAPPEKFSYPEETPFYTPLVNKCEICRDCYADIMGYIQIDLSK